MSISPRRLRRQSGNAVIEASLLGPWVFFMFIALLDFGFYNYALITTENAARVAALYASESRENAEDLTGVCRIVRMEMSGLPNTRNLGGCATSAAGITDDMPLAVSTRLLEPPTNPGPDGNTAAEVTVAYRTVGLIPLPFLTGRLTISRVKQMRINIY